MVRWLFLGLACIIVLSGCAAGTNSLKDTPRDEGEGPAGFWTGLWHGMIILFTFIISIFKSSVSIYEVHNNGFWYNLGFVIGILTVYGGGSCSAARKR